MSNAIVMPASFNGQVAAVFQGQGAGEDLSGGITGGYGLLKYRGKVWSIQHNGQSFNLMREDGDGPRGSVDLVILKANAQLSKTFYINGWDENSNAAPDCASANGIVPDQGVPHPQSTACASCPRNAWGSAPNGGKGKACGDHRRMAVVPLADLRNEHFGGPLLLRCPAASLQDMAAFDSRYKAAGYPYFTMGIKIGFDPAESYPKFTFAAIRPLNEAEAAIVVEMRNTPEVARVVNEGSAPAVAAPAAAPAVTFIQPQQPAPAVASQPNPVATPAPAAVAAGPAPSPAAATTNAGGFGAVAPASGPAPVQVARAAPATAGGFGPVAAADGGGQAAHNPAPTAQPAPAVQPTVPAQHVVVSNPVDPQPAPAPAPAAQVQPATATPVAQPSAQRPSQQMTGFGPTVTPEVTQQAQPATVQPAQPAPQSVSPGVVTAFEGSIDDRLNALLGN